MCGARRSYLPAEEQAACKRLWADVAAAKAAMLTTAGTKLPATHLFVIPELGEWLLSQAEHTGV